MEPLTDVDVAGAEVSVREGGRKSRVRGGERAEKERGRVEKKERKAGKRVYVQK